MLTFILILVVINTVVSVLVMLRVSTAQEKIITEVRAVSATELDKLATLDFATHEEIEQFRDLVQALFRDIVSALSEHDNEVKTSQEVIETYERDSAEDLQEIKESAVKIRAGVLGILAAVEAFRGDGEEEPEKEAKPEQEEEAGKEAEVKPQEEKANRTSPRRSTRARRKS